MKLLTVTELEQLTAAPVGNDQAQMMDALIETATGMIERRLGRKLERGEYSVDRFVHARTVLLDAYPVETVRYVRLDGATLDGWTLDTESGILTLPNRMCGRLEVEYRGGFTEIPAAIKQACALMVLSLRRSVENDGQALMSERLGDYQMMYYQQAGAATSISPVADALLLPWKNRRIAG